MITDDYTSSNIRTYLHIIVHLQDEKCASSSNIRRSLPPFADGTSIKRHDSSPMFQLIPRSWKSIGITISKFKWTIYPVVRRGSIPPLTSDLPVASLQQKGGAMGDRSSIQYIVVNSSDSHFWQMVAAKWMGQKMWSFRPSFSQKPGAHIGRIMGVSQSQADEMHAEAEVTPMPGKQPFGCERTGWRAPNFGEITWCCWASILWWS